MPDRRTLRRWVQKAATKPPRETARLAYRKARDRTASMATRRQDRLRSTYLDDETLTPLARFLEAPPRVVLDSRRSRWDALIDRYCDHRFDLLGSGWVRVHHGMQAAGIEDHRYPPHTGSTQVNQANRRTSDRVRELVQSSYEPIDWQLDFKSGFRWSDSTWYRDVDYGHDPGADVKVPWELARCQHLPVLALRACLARDDGNEDLRTALAREYRNQVLDFIAANPPRFGVQWVTAMDVAIRVSNWLLAYDLIRAADHAFDPEFETVFLSSIRDHGSHIAGNLEWSDELRGNHYLADVIGLVFAASYLPPSTTTDAWLLFATRELLREIRLQFHDDGGGFEGSTCYHRLSAEMVVYAVALLLALPADRVRALAEPCDAVLQATRSFPGSAVEALPLYELEDGRETPVSPDAILRLGRARAFTLDLTRADGRIPQLGDNDSGRFVRLDPVIEEVPAQEAARRFANLDHVAGADPEEPVLVEDHLDHGHLADAIGGLLGIEPEQDRGAGVDGSIIRQLAHPSQDWSHLDFSHADRVEVGNRHTLAEFDARLDALPAVTRRELRIEVGHEIGAPERVAYPIFGVYRWRSERLFLTIRCGPRGQNGFGGHDHNDQLSITLAIDGEDWIVDPGTYVYTPLQVARNRYRSQRAHFGPQLAGPEPASLTEGPFALGPGNEASCIYWGEHGFAGLSVAYDGRIALCRITLDRSEVLITHGSEGAPLQPVAGEESDWQAHLPQLPYSPGYGILERV